MLGIYLSEDSKAAARWSLISGVEYYGTVVRGNRIVGSNPNLLQQLLAVAANCKALQTFLSRCLR